jgi:hypothetical protein
MPVEIKNEYLKKRNAYFKLALSSYFGGEDYIETQIVQHRRESAEGFLKRKKISFNINIVSKVVDVLSSFIIKNRSVGFGSLNENIYLPYKTRIDYYQSIDAFMKKKIAEYLLTGDAFAVIDSGEGKRAYLHDVNVLNLLDWKTGWEGYESADIALGEEAVRLSKTEIRQTKLDRYNENTGWKRELNPIGQMPFVSLTPRLDPERIYLADAVFTNRAIFNHFSSVSNQLWGTGFAILAAPKQPNDPKTNKPRTLDPEVMNYFEIPAYGGMTVPEPKFIEPSLAHISVYQDFILMMIDNLLFSINVYRDKNSVASGISKSYDYSLMTAFLQQTAYEFQEFEKDIWRVLALYDTQLDTDEITVKYGTDFDLKETGDRLNEYLQLLTLGIGGEFDRAIKKRVASDYITNEDELNKINEQIENQGDDNAVTYEYEPGSGGSTAPGSAPEPRSSKAGAPAN